MSNQPVRQLAALQRQGTRLQLRQGTVDTDNGDGTISLSLGGDTVIVDDVASVGDTAAGAGVWLLQSGVDLLALGSPTVGRSGMLLGEGEHTANTSVASSGNFAGVSVPTVSGRLYRAVGVMPTIIKETNPGFVTVYLQVDATNHRRLAILGELTPGAYDRDGVSGETVFEGNGSTMQVRFFVETTTGSVRVRGDQAASEVKVYVYDAGPA